MATLNRVSVVVLLFSVLVNIGVSYANEEKMDRSLSSINHKERSLQGKHKLGGPCEATNPIDQCWRCRPDWETNRFRLADCGKGFGHKTTGGKGGKIYVVTDPSDDNVKDPKPGTLRHAVTRNGPVWITFHRNMFIKLQEELMINSNKTIDARGANVHINGGAGLTMHYVSNIIVHGLHIHDIIVTNGGYIKCTEEKACGRSKADGDGINIFASSNIWIDHVSMHNCSDGLIDIIYGSTDITISNGHFTKHNEAMLFGASEDHKQDVKMRITVAYNHFGKGLLQRMPRARYGFVHVVNNDYTHWKKYAVGGSSHPTIISQGNRYIAQDDRNLKEVTHRDKATEAEWKSWTWRSDQDVFLNGAFFKQSGKPLGKHNFTREQFIEAKPGTLVNQMTKWAGPIKCIKRKPC